VDLANARLQQLHGYIINRAGSHTPLSDAPAQISIPSYTGFVIARALCYGGSQEPVGLTNPQTQYQRGELTMNLEKVFFAFFIVLALTLNFGFFIGELDEPNHHNVYELFAALVVSLIATIMKFGDRAHIGAVLLATSLVADLQLIAAVVIWTITVHATDAGMTPMVLASIVSLSGGALLANITSVIILVTETVMFRR
jgi:hypothetical protein